MNEFKKEAIKYLNKYFGGGGTKWHEKDTEVRMLSNLLKRKANRLDALVRTDALAEHKTKNAIQSIVFGAMIYYTDEISKKRYLANHDYRMMADTIARKVMEDKKVNCTLASKEA